MKKLNFTDLGQLALMNIAVFACMWFLVESVFYVINPLNEKSYRITCSYDWVLYNYCPNVVDVKRNTISDGDNVVFTFTNDLGQRIKKPFEKNPENPEHIFIGDSFIQADEMELEKTFYGRLASRGHTVSAIGYSSWNIIEYREALEKMGHVGAHYHVFLMPNDVTPTYDRSVYQERIAGPERKLDILIPSSFAHKISRAYTNSLTKKLEDLLTQSPEKPPYHALKPLVTSEFDRDHINDCEPLNQLDESYKQALGYDYLVYSKKPSCWPIAHREAADAALDELMSLVKLATELDASLTIYMVPPGWSFPNQNSRGRHSNEHYFFGDETVVTTEPLTHFFSSQVLNVKFVSLEEVLFKPIQDCGDCTDYFYFSADGHWTPETHELLADYFDERLREPDLF